MKIIKYSPLLLLLSHFIILSYNCDLETPKAPNYELPLKLVLVDTTYTVKDLSNESDNLSINENTNLLEFNIDGTIDTVDVEEELSIDPINYSSYLKIGEFEVKIDDTIRDSSLVFQEINPALLPFDGQQIAVAPFTFPSLQTDPISFDEIVYVAIASGFAKVTIENKLHVPIQDITAQLYDERDNYIDQVEFPYLIPVDSSASESMNLAGKLFSNQIYIKLFGKSPGSGGEQILIDLNDYILVEISVDNIKALEAEAQIPSINIESEQEVELTDKMVIEEAKFRSGRIRLLINNNLPLEAYGEVRFKDILKDGNPLTINLTFNSGQSAYDVDLKECVIKPEIVSTGQMQKMKVKINADTKDTETNIIHLTKDQSIAVDLSLEDLAFEYIKGVFNGQVVQINPHTSTIDLPDGFENIQLNQAKLQLNFYNRINFPIDIALKLKGISNSGQAVNMSLDNTITASGLNKETSTHITLDETNSNIIDFMNNFPSTVQVWGTAYLGDGMTSGTIFHDDYVRAQYDITTPVQMVFEKKTINLDTTKIFITPQDYDSSNKLEGETIEASITERLKSAEIFVSIANHLPIGMDISVKISDDLKTLFNNPQLLIGPITMPAGERNINGEVIKEKLVENRVVITSDELNIFKNETNDLKTLYVGTEIHIFGTDGKMVSVNRDDYVKINASTRFQVEVNPEY